MPKIFINCPDGTFSATAKHELAADLTTIALHTENLPDTAYVRSTVWIYINEYSGANVFHGGQPGGTKIISLEVNAFKGGLDNGARLNLRKPLKSFFIFPLLLLIIMIESCNQPQKRPATETTANPSQTNNKNNMNTTISNNPLAAGLIRVGKEGIETGDDQVLDAYFARDFVFHGPGGDLNLTQLKEVFSNYRNALTDFTITREQIIVEGNFMGARNTFSGTFDYELKQSPVGPIKPTGKPVKWEVINTFRYNDEGLLAEEWVQTDNIIFLKQFGVDILKTKSNQDKSSEK